MLLVLVLAFACFLNKGWVQWRIGWMEQTANTPISCFFFSGSCHSSHSSRMREDSSRLLFRRGSSGSLQSCLLGSNASWSGGHPFLCYWWRRPSQCCSTSLCGGCWSPIRSCSRRISFLPCTCLRSCPGLHLPLFTTDSTGSTADSPLRRM